MPLTDKGKKIMQSMKRTYGGRKGEQVFYATRNAGKLTAWRKNKNSRRVAGLERWQKVEA